MAMADDAQFDFKPEFEADADIRLLNSRVSAALSIGDQSRCPPSSVSDPGSGELKNSVLHNHMVVFASQEASNHESCGIGSPRHVREEAGDKKAFMCWQVEDTGRCRTQAQDNENSGIEEQLTVQLGERHRMLPQTMEEKHSDEGGFRNQEMPKTEEWPAEFSCQNSETLDNEISGSMGQKMVKLEEYNAQTPERGFPSQKMDESSKGVSEFRQNTRDEYCDCGSLAQQVLKSQGLDFQSLKCTMDEIDCHRDMNTGQKQRKYFYYDTPLHEDTGAWIPVSVPPMSESEHEEWAKGLSLNGGYFPEPDMGWSYTEEDKDMTMWDVVVEMLLAARGKVSTLASGDFCNISWISSHLIEQAWKEMAQTLTEANFGHTQEILEAEPPKWLPDSSAASCMLCSVRFHPIMCTRHHCRFCGGIFCGECTKGRSLLPEKFRVGDPQRVCDVCCVRLESVQPYLMDQVSRAAQLPTHDLTDLSTLRSWVNFPWGQSMEYEIYKAANTIKAYNTKVCSLRPEKSIPDAILRQAKGLAILTIVKVGMMVTYNIGTGLVVSRREDGSWSPPSAISSFGMGWGAQFGGELADLIIVLRTEDAIKTFVGDLHLSVGAGLSAAFGVVGRAAGADLRAGIGSYSPCYTYSCSKGAFVGCSLEGSVVTTRTRENSRFYGSQSISASDILLGPLPSPPAAAALYSALACLYQKLEG